MPADAGTICRDPRFCRTRFARWFRARQDDRLRRPKGAAEIATRANISKKFLDAIIPDLKNVGFVRSRKGPGGGFAVSRPSSEIVVGPVVRALDGPLAPIACASRTAFQPCYDCGDLSICAMRLLIIEVRDAIATTLEGTALADLLDKSTAGSLLAQ